MTASRWLLAMRPSSVRLRVLVGDLIRKGIVRPAGVSGVGAPCTSSEDHSSSAAETSCGIIFSSSSKLSSKVE